jgi:hypothetical protein
MINVFFPSGEDMLVRQSGTRLRTCFDHAAVPASVQLDDAARAKLNKKNEIES